MTKFTIGKKIGALLLLMVLIAAANILIIYRYQYMQEYDSRIVNIAGRQRMLSQKIAKLVLSVAGGNDGDRILLQVCVDLYDSSLRVLQYGGNLEGSLIPPAPDALTGLFEKNKNIWNLFKQKAEIVARQSRHNSVFSEAIVWHRIKWNAESVQRGSRDNLLFKGAVERIQRSNSELLSVSNEVTGKFDEIFSGKAARLRTLLVIMLGGDVFIFIIGLLMANSLAKPIRELSETAVRIGEGDFTRKIVIPDSNDEIRDLAKAFVKMTEDLQQTTVSKNFVDDIMRSMTDTLIVVDMNKNITTVNKAASEILGYKEEEIIDLPFSEVLAGENVDISIFEKLGKEDSVENIEITCKTKTENCIPMLFSGSLMKDKEGNLEGVVGIARDITERKRMEERERLRALALEKCVNKLEDLVETLKLDAHLAKQILYILNGDIPHNIELSNDLSLFFHCISLSCHQNGGDHCFVREMPKNAEYKGGRTIISLKDQSGHAVACILRSLITDMIHQDILHSNCDYSLEHMLTKLNNNICGSHIFPLGAYFTSVDGEIDHETLKMRFSSSGHPPFIHIRGDNVNSYPVLGGPGHNSVPVMFDDINFEAGELQLEPGDKLILYTDGLTDAASGNISINVDKLMAMIGEFVHMPVSEIMTRTLARVAELSGRTIDPSSNKNTTEDDITLLGVEIEKKYAMVTGA